MDPIVFLTISFIIFFIIKRWKNNDFKEIIYNTSITEFIPNTIKLHEKYGKTIKIRIFGLRLITLTTDLELTANLLRSNVNLKKSASYEVVRAWLGDGLLLSTGNKWKSRRKITTPAFHFSILEKFIEVMELSSNILVKNLSNFANSKPFDIHSWISLCSLDIICESSMGVRLNAQTVGENEYANAVKEFLLISAERIFYIWQRNPLLFRFSSKYNRYKKCLQILHEFTDDVIRKRRKSFNKSIKPSEQTPLIDILLMNDNLTNNDIREEIDTFLFEGHETISTMITYALYELAKNPKIQSDVYSEILGVDDGNKLNYNKLQQMKCLERVIKEVGRLYPPVPLLGRVIEEDIMIDNKRIPANSTVAVNVYALHRSEQLYENANTFNPERFWPENQADRHFYSYVLFSAGPRNCIGQRFAMLEMKTILIKILKKFEILPVNDYELKLVHAGVLKPTTPIPIKIKFRTQNI